MATDQSILTRNMFIRTIAEQQFYFSPVYAAMFESGRVNWGGGEQIEKPVDTNSQAGVDLVQEYANGDTPLTNGVRYPLAKVTFGYQKWQIPIEYDVDEWLVNVKGSQDSKLVDLVKTRVANTHKWHRQYLISKAYSTTSTEADSAINSIPLACGHSRTYGSITTSTVANTYWNGASIGNNWTDSSTNYGYSIDTIRRAYDTIVKYRDDAEVRVLCIVPTSAFRKLKREAEGKHIITGEGLLMKYGHNSITIDGKIEITADKWLENAERKTELFMLDVNTWELRMHKDRNFMFTDFEWQANQPGGLDKWTARIMNMGQLICWQPNANLYLDSLT